VSKVLEVNALNKPAELLCVRDREPQGGEMTDIRQVVIAFPIEQKHVMLPCFERRLVSSASFPRHVQACVHIFCIDVKENVCIGATTPLIARDDVNTVRLDRLSFHHRELDLVRGVTDSLGLSADAWLTRARWLPTGIG